MLMKTDSEALLVAGISLAKETWHKFEDELGWSAQTIERVVTHQVGTAHRRALLNAVGIDPVKDHPTVEFLGNIGSVSLPITYALARETGFASAAHSTALLGIGSGLNCSMLAIGL